ncbi:hypothetical protein ACQ1PN_12010 [Ornithobacterium rhinotracheale]
MVEDKNIPPTPLTEIGQLGLNDRIKQSVKNKNPTTPKGIADDAAVLDFRDKQVVVSNDMLTQGVHFNLPYTQLNQIAYKEKATNERDI